MPVWTLRDRLNAEPPADPAIEEAAQAERDATVLAAYLEHGENKAHAAAALGMPSTSFNKALDQACERAGRPLPRRQVGQWDTAALAAHTNHPDHAVAAAESVGWHPDTYRYRLRKAQDRLQRPGRRDVPS